MAIHLQTLLASALLAATPGVASAGDASAEADVAKELRELRREIAELRRDSDADWLTEQRAGEIRGVVTDVLADASDRVSLQDAGATAGWNKGFFLASPDGSFKLKIGGQIQVRWVLNSAGEKPTLYGFENRRTKLSFSGNVFDKSWTYKVKAGFARFGGFFVLEDAYVQKKLESGIAIKVGQFKAPWMREELVSSSKQLTVERSIVNEYFNQGYSQGIQIAFEAEDFRVAAWTGDGIGSRGFGPGRTNSQNTNWDQTSTDYSFAARAEFKLSGEWSQFKDFSSARGSDAGMMAGLAAVTQRANQNIGAAEGTKVYGVTGDFTWDLSGVSLFCSGVWINVDEPGSQSTNPWGVTIQGGHFVTETIEAFARYEYMDYDPPTSSDVARFDGFTVGGNWFINKGVKFTADFTYNFASLATGAFVANIAGFRTDNPGQDGQWAIRAQLQLLF